MRSLLKANPEQEARKCHGSKPMGRMAHINYVFKASPAS